MTQIKIKTPERPQETLRELTDRSPEKMALIDMTQQKLAALARTTGSSELPAAYRLG